MGQRTLKIVKEPGTLAQPENWKYEYYRSDASGNIMANYTLNKTDNVLTLTAKEHNLYGGSRLGIVKSYATIGTNANVPIPQPTIVQTPPSYYIYDVTNPNTFTITPTITAFTRTFGDDIGTKNYEYGNVRFELSNHLGNVLSVITDRKLPVEDDDEVGYFNPDIIITNDYYAFGSSLPGRSFNSSDYKFGFNGKENDSESGTQDYGFRIYNPNLCKFLSVDPLRRKFPMLTPYQFGSNNPIWCIDLDGLEGDKKSSHKQLEEVQKNHQSTLAFIDEIYHQSGGDEAYKGENYNSWHDMKGETQILTGDLATQKFKGNDSKGDPYNRWVNTSTIYYEAEGQITEDNFCNVMMGHFVNGRSADIHVFPLDGSVSKAMKNSLIVTNAYKKWIAQNIDALTNTLPRKELTIFDEFMSFGALGYIENIRDEFSVEGFVGSAQVTIVPSYNQETIKITIFNVTSLTSGQEWKGVPFTSTTPSIVNEPSTVYGAARTPYSNFAQIFQLTMPIPK